MSEEDPQEHPPHLKDLPTIRTLILFFVKDEDILYINSNHVFYSLIIF